MASSETGSRLRGVRGIELLVKLKFRICLWFIDPTDCGSSQTILAIMSEDLGVPFDPRGMFLFNLINNNSYKQFHSFRILSNLQKPVINSILKICLINSIHNAVCSSFGSIIK